MAVVLSQSPPSVLHCATQEALLGPCLAKALVSCGELGFLSAGESLLAVTEGTFGHCPLQAQSVEQKVMVYTDSSPGIFVIPRSSDS